MVLETLERHDRRDLPFRDELAAEVEERSEIDVREVVGLVRICLFGGRVADVAGWWACGHQCVT